MKRRRATGTVAIGVLFGLLFTASPASATTIYSHNFLGSFDGTGSLGPGNTITAPFNTVGQIAINQATGSVFIFDTGTATIDKFDASGSPQAFSSLGAGINSLPVPYLGGLPMFCDCDMALDNSGSASQGQIYEFQQNQVTYAYASSGASLGGNFPLSPPGDVCGDAVDPQGNYWWSQPGAGMIGYNSTGVPLNQTIGSGAGVCHLAIDGGQPGSHPTAGYFYLGVGSVRAYNPAGVDEYTVDPEGTSTVAVDPTTGEIYANHYDHVSEWAPSDPVNSPNTPGAKLSTFGTASPGFGGMHADQCFGTRGIAVNKVTHYVYVADCGKVDIFGSGASEQIPTVTTDFADVAPTSAVLNGHATSDGGGDTTDCHFEYGPDTNYGTTVPCAVPSGPIHDADGNVAVSAPVTGLVQGNTYHFRLVVGNPNGNGYGADRVFKPQGPPGISGVGVSSVNTDGARIASTVDPSGGDTRYHFDWGTTAAYGHSTPFPDQKLPDVRTIQTEVLVLTGLQPGTTYHYRLVAHNDQGASDSGDHTFTTFEENPTAPDSCPNAHERQQTGAALLFDCRAYELVSASSTNGYDVQSDFSPGQAPLTAYPYTNDRLIYAVHFGTIPSAGGNPTNFGLDPYLATRGPSGWTTRYVGISAVGTPTVGPFASPLGAANGSLDTLVFSGPNLCSPCFADGTTGLPVRMPNGSLVQGMAGSLDPGPPATEDGFVGKALSADGSHLVFGSTSQFEPDGNLSGSGDVSIYDRDLSTGVTHVVSKDPNGANLACLGGAGTCHSPGDPNGIGELDISDNGSRVIVAQRVSTDIKGNNYWHPYMNIGDANHSVDLAPGTTSGVLYDGMTTDGSKVFFTTTDKLLPAVDTDNSADIYEADVSAGGSVTLHLVSTGTGGTGNSDACNAVSNLESSHWNSVSSANCSVLAFAGGAGTAAGDGTVFFLSPETLDGSGTQDQPNLFVVRPGGSPKFVTTLEADGLPVKHALAQTAVHRYGEFQVTPNGQDAVFASKLPLTGFDNRGHSEVYRYDTFGDSLDCASCALTNAFATSDAVLAQYGLSVSDDGRVFFTSGEPLALRDSNSHNDVYEWENGKIQLISTGIGTNGSGLFSVSKDGTDVYFFTHDTLVPADLNGQLVKIYDARAGGGFASNPPVPPCQASDECHGPGTQAAPPPSVGTYAGTGGNRKATRKRHRHRRRHHHRPKNKPKAKIHG